MGGFVLKGHCSVATLVHVEDTSNVHLVDGY